jgi:aspartyl-tRNA(Asn)/glutamyl-tRNA(Gln) amidotransferase subunit B
MGPVKNWLNENGCDIASFPLAAGRLAEMVAIVEDGTVNFSMAASRLLPAAIAKPADKISQLAVSLGIVQEKNADELESWVNAALDKMPDKVLEYRKGKKGLLGLFVGEVKRLSKGKADPQLVSDMLQKKLNA